MKKTWTLSELKEVVLSLLALLWAILLMFPGEILSRGSEFDLLAIYAGDAIWASFLLIASLFLLFAPRNRYRVIRRAAHAFFWLFWLAISILVLVRVSGNGFSISDILICSPFVTIAFIHAAFYVRLVYTT